MIYTKVEETECAYLAGLWSSLLLCLPALGLLLPPKKRNRVNINPSLSHLVFQRQLPSHRAQEAARALPLLTSQDSW